MDSNKFLDIGRCVVLGARGFVGKALSPRLPASSLMLSSEDLDLLSPEASQKLSSQILPDDTVVFISALTPDKGRGSDTLVKNIVMAQAVIEALEKSPCRHLIYISSDAVYDDRLTLVREDSVCDPQSFHGCMHITREKMLLDLAQKKKIPFLRLRPCAIYGVGDTHNSYGPNRFLRSMREQGFIQLGGKGEEQRDHLYINDFCEVIVESIANRLTGILNVASGSALSFHQVAEEMAEIMGKGNALRYSDRSGPITHKHFDMTKFYETFDALTLTPFRKGIEEVIAITEEHHHG